MGYRNVRWSMHFNADYVSCLLVSWAWAWGFIEILTTLQYALRQLMHFSASFSQVANLSNGFPTFFLILITVPSKTYSSKWVGFILHTNPKQRMRLCLKSAVKLYNFVISRIRWWPCLAMKYLESYTDSAYRSSPVTLVLRTLSSTGKCGYDNAYDGILEGKILFF